MENTDSKIWIDWIEEAITRKHIKYYEYQHFSNFHKIGSGAFGMVYRVNWKNSEQHLVLKSFFNLDNATVKEIVREVITKLIICVSSLFRYEANDLLSIYDFSLNFNLKLIFITILSDFMELPLQIKV